MVGQVVFALFILVLGFVLLMKGADFFVEGSSSIAKQFRIPGLVIGMTIVAMGTSLPELAVSLTASISHNNSLAISNVVGSNIFNLMIVLGVSAIISSLYVSDIVVKRDFPFSVVCAILLMIFGYFGMKLNRWEGVIFLVLFVLFLFVMLHHTMKSRKEGLETEVEVVEEAEIESEIKILPTWRSLLYIVAGMVAIHFGGDWVVEQATYFAKLFGVSETLIGLTIVACGTSLPELVTSIAAAKKKELDMAVGNVVGSNIFDIIFILGISATITPVGFINENLMDIVVLLVFSLIVWLFSKTKHKLGKKEGIAMIILYVIYLVYICMR